MTCGAKKTQAFLPSYVTTLIRRTYRLLIIEPALTMPLLQTFNRLFPLWAILLGALGFYFPAMFTPLSSAIAWLLALVMFAMGLTLSSVDFYRVAREPKPILLGLALQFTLMPLAALAVSRLLGLSVELTTGMVLVGTVAGGTASNVITWLAGGRVALSVSMTLTATLASVVLTPLLTWLLLRNTVEINTLGMLWGIAKIVVAPVLMGVLLHHFFAAGIKRLEPALASIAVILISVIIAIVVALNAGRLASIGALVLVAVVLHNSIGLTAGY